MDTPETISSGQLTRLVGTPDAPVIIDVRVETPGAVAETDWGRSPLL
jgi:hypothetical protein